MAPSRPQNWQDAGTVEFADEGFPARTLVHLAPAPDEADGDAARYRLRLKPGERWQLLVAVQWLLNGTPALDGAAFEERLRDDRRERDASLAAWWRAAPRLQAPAELALERTWEHSLADLAALRLHWAGSGMVPAAGLPWFMTLFGRDTLITSFQELILGPDAAAGALRALADAQAEIDDPERDAEPGKIVHELRRGKTALSLDRSLLRHGRRDAAVPRSALGALALDRRRRDRARAGAGGAPRAQLDRLLRRPRW